MKIIKGYLTSDEMMEIVDTLIKEDSAIAREVIKIGMVLQCVCDDIDDYKNCNELYDAYMQEAFDLELEVKNYSDIDYLVEQEMGVAKTVRVMFDVLADKIQNINIEELSQQLVAMKESIK